MSNWSYAAGGGNRPGLTAAAGSFVSSPTANAWTQISASAPFDVGGVYCGVWGSSATRFSIGVGGGTPTTIAGSFLAGSGSMRPILIPVSIPKGSVISLFMTTGVSFMMAGLLEAGGSQLNTPRVAIPFGAPVATAPGVWTEIVVSSPDALAIKALFNFGGSGNSLAIGTGATAGAVTQICEAAVGYSENAGELLIAQPIPAGSHVWVKSATAMANVQLIALT